MGRSRGEYVCRHWFIFGEWPDGRVNLNDGEKDIWEKLTRKDAEAIIAARDKLIELLDTTSGNPSSDSVT